VDVEGEVGLEALMSEKEKETTEPEAKKEEKVNN